MKKNGFHSGDLRSQFRGRAGSVSLSVMEHSMAERLADLAERKNEALHAG